MPLLSKSIKVGLLTLFFFAGSYGVWKSLSKDVVGTNGYILEAVFKDAKGLKKKGPVEIAGLPVGEIRGLSIDGKFARVRFAVRGDVEVFSNAVVHKRATSLLGGYYLELDPGDPARATASGEKATRLGVPVGAPNEIFSVVEATSPEQLMRRIEQSMPNVDRLLLSVYELSEELRVVVKGPLNEMADRLNGLVQDEAVRVSEIIGNLNTSMARLDQITADVKFLSNDARKRFPGILANVDETISSTRTEVEMTGKKVREKLELVDELLSSSTSIANKIDDDQGTLGRLVNDPTIADNVEEITEDVGDFVAGVTQLKTFVGLRSEYNVLSEKARFYLSVEFHTRPDKYFLFELEKGPRGDYPVVTLEYDPTIDRNRYIRKVRIDDKLRFTIQFAKRFGPATFRYGVKDSTGGVGLDLEGKWFNRKLKFSADVFDATFDQLPRVKLAILAEVFQNFYILGGVDEALNTPERLEIDTGEFDEPVQFESFYFGRDYFVGFLLKFDDRDLATLFTVAGGLLGGLAN